MTNSIPYSGIWPALLTPLTEHLDIDIPALSRHALHLLASGCTGVTPFGTTGEGPSFTVDERRRAIDGMIQQGVPAERILVSTSCAALPDVITLTKHAAAAGTKGCLILPPFFLKNVPDQGVIDAYTQIIDGVADARLRVVLYNIPQVSGVALSHNVVSTLLARYPDTIIGIKDSGCQRDVSVAFAKAFMPPLQVWVGNEPDLPTVGALGSNGAVSGVANLMPQLVGRLVGHYPSSDPAGDMARLQAFLGILGGYGMTAAFKGMMACTTGQPGWRRVRAPLVALSDAEYAQLEQQLKAFHLDPSKD